jgi:hypothetical protein
MLVQTQTKSKARLPLLIVMGVLFLATGVLLYRTYFVATDIDLAPPPLSVSSSSFQTTFETDILEDVRIKGLRMHGSAEVQVQERGLKDNPFQAF